MARWFARLSKHVKKLVRNTSAKRDGSILNEGCYAGARIFLPARVFVNISWLVPITMSGRRFLRKTLGDSDSDEGALGPWLKPGCGRYLD